MSTKTTTVKLNQTLRNRTPDQQKAITSRKEFGRFCSASKQHGVGKAKVNRIKKS